MGLLFCKKTNMMIKNVEFGQTDEVKTLKILVLSDSHSMQSFMRRCISQVKPDAVIHLGDYFEDGEAVKEEFPGIPFYQVPGNCDLYRCSPGKPEILVETFGGVTMYLTHGHRHKVKSYLAALLRDARKCRVKAALYGHTHVADCHQEEDGLWVLNPGSCGYFGGSAGLIEIANGEIRSCRILREEDFGKL